VGGHVTACRFGTFKPVETDDIEQHHIHTEFVQLSAGGGAGAGGQGRSPRHRREHHLSAGAGDGGAARARGPTPATALYIYPGYEYRAIDGLITNFHLPRSSLLMLVSALAGKANIDRAYAEAIAQKYRFFSFGDAMFIR
jgi:S-adenosylmethionine:tRNA ribosyltransferase-isomerase